MIVERLGPQRTGIVLLVVAAILLVTAVILAWDGIDRWRAAANLRAFRLATLVHAPSDDSRVFAQRAAALLPREAATTLAAIDLADPAAGGRLETLAGRVRPGERPLVHAALALHALVHGRTPTVSPEGGDGELLGRIAAMERDHAPAGLRWSTAEPAHASVARWAAQRQLELSWTQGDAAGLRAGAGALRLLWPDHPQAPLALAIAAGLDPASPTEAVTRALPSSDRERWLRLIAHLAPDRAPALLALIAPDRRTPDEQQVLISSGREALDNLVSRAVAQPDEATLITLARRALDANRLDLVRKLAEKAAAPSQSAMRLAIALREGDLATVATLAPKDPSVLPTASTPVGRPGLIAFHLATPSGLVPRSGELDVRVEGHLLPSDKVARLGSLVQVEVSQITSARIEVRLGGRVVLASEVTL